MKPNLRLCALLVTAALLGPAPATAERPPHIVMLLADDVGWADVGYHGSDIRTPHLDRLAGEGVRLDQLYVDPICTPTRASLMTGRYAFRYGLQSTVVHAWDREGLPASERLLPEALREAGYRTAIVGKWHLGHAQPDFLPLQRGFQHHYGPYIHASYFSHLMGRRDTLDWHRNGSGLREEGYATRLLAREAVALIERHDPARPLFLYVPFTAAHGPMEAPADALAAYAGMNSGRQLYAAVVSIMDEAVGEIRAALERKGMAPDTLVLFASDNGPQRGLGGSAAPLRGWKGQTYEGGIRVPALATWAGRLPAGAIVDEPLHIVDLYPTLLGLAGVTTEQAQPLDGRDAWPTLALGARSPHREILHRVQENHGAIRRGDWKLAVNPDLTAPRWWRTKVELFHIARDPREETNVASLHPERVEELLARLEELESEAAPPLLIKKKPRGYEFPAVLGEGPNPAGVSGWGNYLRSLLAFD